MHFTAVGAYVIQGAAAASLELLITEAHGPAQLGREEGQAEVLYEEGDDKVQELKRAIGDVYTFVSQHVALDARGRGSCPFHPPDRHPSFAVNREEGFASCQLVYIAVLPISDRMKLCLILFVFQHIDCPSEVSLQLRRGSVNM